MKALNVIFVLAVSLFLGSCSKDTLDPPSPNPPSPNPPTPWIEFNNEDVLRGELPNKVFVENWETQETVLRARIDNNNILDKIATPWASGSIGDIPSHILQDIKKEKGWTMAFCLIGIPDKPGANYFALYNKYTGVLRIFYFNDTKVTAGGNEWQMVTQWTLDGNEQPATLYHNLPIALPNGTKAKSFKPITDVVYKGSEEFSTLCTPWHASESAMPSSGWTVADLDLSCYREQAGRLSDKSNAALRIGFNTSKTGSITLKQFIDNSNPQANESVSSSLGVLKKVNDNAWKVADVIQKIISGNYVEATRLGIGALFGIMGDIDGGSASKTPPLAFNGTFQSQEANDIPKVNLHLNHYAVTDHAFEEGCWALNSVPSMAYCRDAFSHTGDYKDWKYYRVGFDRELTGGWNIAFRGIWPFDKKYWGFMPLWLDPTTIAPVINDKIFKNAHNFTVSSYWGLYVKYGGSGHDSYKYDFTRPYREIQHTEGMQMMKSNSGVYGYNWVFKDNESRTTFHLGWDSGDGKKPATDPFNGLQCVLGHLPWSYTGYPDVNTYIIKAVSDLTQMAMDGRRGDIMGNLEFWVNPDIRLPVYEATKGEGLSTQHFRAVLETNQVPEPIVTVTIAFKYTDDAGKEQDAVFTKRFVANIWNTTMDQLTNQSEWETTYRNICDLRTKSQNKQPWHNPNSKGPDFYHVYGDFMGYISQSWIDWSREAYKRKW